MHTAVTTFDGLHLAVDHQPGTGVPVVLLHGGGQNRHSWARLAAALGDRGHETFAVDQRGHGESDWSGVGAYEVDAYGRDVVAVLQLIGRPAVLVGASLGGVASIVAAAVEPDRVERVVLIDITTRPHQPGVSRIREFMLAHVGGFATVDEAVAAVNQYLAHRSKPSDADSVQRNLRRHADGRWHWHWDPRVLDSQPQAGEWTELDTAARRIAMPVLLVRGEHSDVVLDADVERFRELVPQAEVAVVPGAQHMVAGDRNDAFVAVISEYLQRHYPEVWT